MKFTRLTLTPTCFLVRAGPYVLLSKGRVDDPIHFVPGTGGRKRFPVKLDERSSWTDGATRSRAVGQPVLEYLSNFFSSESGFAIWLVI
jgi:hypothetical protein